MRGPERCRAVAIPSHLLDAAVAGVLIDRRPVEHEAVTVAHLMLDGGLDAEDAIPPLAEIEAQIAEAVAAEREAEAERGYLIAAYWHSRGIGTGRG
jgi:hypothetical protein